MTCVVASRCAPDLLPLARTLPRPLLPEPGQRVLVALSGGLDSVVLLHLLRFARRELRLELHAAHFDHALRPESAADAAWVRGLCRAWDVPLHSVRAHVPPRGEAGARTVRYRFLRAVAARIGAARILTAHHADDQLETLIFRLARGTGLRGLAGIPPERGLLLRPLLQARRTELLAYARAVGLGWREDASNRSMGFARNRIRHRLLPVLERERPDAVASLLRLSELAAGLEWLWERELPEVAGSVVMQTSPGEIQLARPVLQEYHPQTRARVLRYLLRPWQGVPGRAETRRLLDFIGSAASGARYRLGGGTEVWREFDRIVLHARAGTTEPDQPLRIAAPDAGVGRARVGGQELSVEWGPGAPSTDSGPAASFDPTALRFPLVLRGWQAGDRIQLGYGTKKLKKLFAERRIGRRERHRIALLVEQGTPPRVLWVAGVAQAAGTAPAAESWHIRVRHGESG